MAAATSSRMMEAREAQCPTGYMGDGWDVAHAALFLASDDARYVTGAELLVDGGITAKIDLTAPPHRLNRPVHGNIVCCSDPSNTGLGVLPLGSGYRRMRRRDRAVTKSLSGGTDEAHRNQSSSDGNPGRRRVRRRVPHCRRRPQAVELKAATFMSPKHAINRGVIPALAKNLAEETGGSLTVKLFPSRSARQGPGPAIQAGGRQRGRDHIRHPGLHADHLPPHHGRRPARRGRFLAGGDGEDLEGLRPVPEIGIRRDQGAGAVLQLAAGADQPQESRSPSWPT